MVLVGPPCQGLAGFNPPVDLPLPQAGPGMQWWEGPDAEQAQEDLEDAFLDHVSDDMPDLIPGSDDLDLDLVQPVLPMFNHPHPELGLPGEQMDAEDHEGVAGLNPQGIGQEDGGDSDDDEGAVPLQQHMDADQLLAAAHEALVAMGNDHVQVLQGQGGLAAGGAGAQAAADAPRPLLQALQEALGGQPLCGLRSLSLYTHCREFSASALARISTLVALDSLKLVAEPTGRSSGPNPQVLAEVLAQLGHLPKLRSLDLAGMHFKLDAAAVAASAPLYPHLTRLSFEGRFALKSSDTAVFCGLEGLRHLELKQSRADPFMFRPKLSLTWLPGGLEKLELKQIEVLSPRVAGFSCLQHLSLKDCSVHSLEAFGACPHLLHFEHNQLSSYRRDASLQIQILQPLVRLWPRLTTLKVNFYIPYETLSPEVLMDQFRALSQLRDLRHLVFQSYCRNVGRGYQVLHSAVRHLSHLPYLRSLHLNPVSAAAVSELAKLSQLVHMRLDSHALLELTALGGLKTLQYSEDFGRWAYDTSALRVDPVQLHCVLGQHLPLTTIVDIKGGGGYSSFQL